MYSTDIIEISYQNRLVDNSGKYAIADEGRILTVTNVTKDDAGRYVCDTLGEKPARQRYLVAAQQRPTSNAVSVFVLKLYTVIALCVDHLQG